jgi:hypothetical protein
MDSHEILELIDAAVARDEGPSGLRGTVCVGVRGRHQDWWWTGSFGAEPQRMVSTLLDERADAILLLAGEHNPEPLVSGDSGLLERFIRRYLRPESVVSVRIPGSKE